MSTDREAVGPFCMENTFSVNAAAGMDTKIIPLGLNQIGWKLKGSVGIESAADASTETSYRDGLNFRF